MLRFWDDFGVIFYHCGIIVGIILGSFWDHFGIILGSFALLGGPLGGPWGFLGSLGGSLEAPLVHPRPPLGSQVARGVLPGIFREFSGRFREPFWLHFGSLFCDFSCCFSASFFDGFLCRFFIDFEWILEVVFDDFLNIFCCFCEIAKMWKIAPRAGESSKIKGREGRKRSQNTFKMVA